MGTYVTCRARTMAGRAAPALHARRNVLSDAGTLNVGRNVANSVPPVSSLALGTALIRVNACCLVARLAIDCLATSDAPGSSTAITVAPVCVEMSARAGLCASPVVIKGPR